MTENSAFGPGFFTSGGFGGSTLENGTDGGDEFSFDFGGGANVGSEYLGAEGDVVGFEGLDPMDEDGVAPDPDPQVLSSKPPWSHITPAPITQNNPEVKQTHEDAHTSIPKSSMTEEVASDPVNTREDRKPVSSTPIDWGSKMRRDRSQRPRQSLNMHMESGKGKSSGPSALHQLKQMFRGPKTKLGELRPSVSSTSHSTPAASTSMHSAAEKQQQRSVTFSTEPKAQDSSREDDARVDVSSHPHRKRVEVADNLPVSQEDEEQDAVLKAMLEIDKEQEKMIQLLENEKRSAQRDCEQVLQKAKSQIREISGLNTEVANATEGLAEEQLKLAMSYVQALHLYQEMEEKSKRLEALTTTSG